MTDYGPLVDRIREWDKAYPLWAFPEPPSWDDHGISVEACSARMGRHVIGRLMEIIDECKDNDRVPEETEEVTEEYCVRIGDGAWIHTHDCSST